MRKLSYKKRSRIHKLKVEKNKRTLSIVLKMITIMILITCLILFLIYGKERILGNNQNKILKQASLVTYESMSEPETIPTVSGTVPETPPSMAASADAEMTQIPETTLQEPPAVPDWIDVTKPMIAFTFDDGPFYKVDSRILDVLSAYGGHATFFIVGSRIKDYPETLRKINESGCEIGNHSFDHKNLENLTPDEVINQIESVNDTVESITGFRPRLVRVPYGAFGGQVSELVAYPMIQWNVDTEDWKSKDKDAIVKMILKHASDGSIILMHDLYPATAEAFEEAVPQLAAQGYQFVTVSEMYAAKQVPMEPGTVYFDLKQH